uniref:hypothetical protein n=1 Tax=Jatropha curcas TaxID=180498 RepID=UPI0027A43F96|nr:hypothetical protein QLP06_mgp048 [Jatropha curcas]WFG81191.1 hypothetical protein [Jatropha curcas]
MQLKEFRMETQGLLPQKVRVSQFIRILDQWIINERSFTDLAPNSSLLTNHCASCLRWKRGKTGSCWVWCFEESESRSFWLQNSIILSLRNPGLSLTRTESNLHCLSSAHFP